MDIISIISNYYVTGGFMILETGLILLLVGFLVYNVKLFMEEPREGEELEEMFEEQEAS
jgi:hypothetical protein